MLIERYGHIAGGSRDSRGATRSRWGRHGPRDADRALGDPSRGARREGRQPADHRRRLALRHRGDPGPEPRGGAARRADAAPLRPGAPPRRGLAAQERGADGAPPPEKKKAPAIPANPAMSVARLAAFALLAFAAGRAGAARGRAADGHPGAGGGGRLPLRHRRRARRRLGARRPPPRRVGGRHGLARAGPRPRGPRGRAPRRGAGRRPGRARASSSRAPAGSGRRWPTARERRRTAATSRRIRRARFAAAPSRRARPPRGPESRRESPRGARLRGAVGGDRRAGRQPDPAADRRREMADHPARPGPRRSPPLGPLPALAEPRGLAGEDGGALAGSPEPARRRSSTGFAGPARPASRAVDPLANLEVLAGLPPRDAVLAAYHRFLDLLESRGYPRPVKSTPYEVLNALPFDLRSLADPARTLTELYVQAAYSGEPVEPGAREQAIFILKGMRGLLEKPAALASRSTAPPASAGSSAPACSSCGRPRSEMRDRGLAIAGPFQQVRADGVEAMVARQPRVGVERLQQLEPRRRAVHHRRRDRVVQRSPSDCRTSASARRTAPGSAASRCPRRAPPRRARPRSRPAAGTAPTEPLRQRRGDERDALGDRAPVPQRFDPARRAGSARPPARSAPRAARRSAASAPAAPRPRRRPGSELCTARVRRIASLDRSVRCSSGPELAV